MWKKALKDLPGIGKYYDILVAKGITHILDLSPSDIDRLPTEARLALTYLDGDPYSRNELEEFIDLFTIPFCKLSKCKKCELAGSYRRGKEICNDADIVALDCTSIVLQETDRLRIVRFGDRKARILYRLSKRWIPADIAFVSQYEYIFALMHYTGSKEFNIAMRKHAIAKGYKLNEYGLWKNNKRIAIKDERDIFRKLGVKYKPITER